MTLSFKILSWLCVFLVQFFAYKRVNWVYNLVNSGLKLAHKFDDRLFKIENEFTSYLKLLFYLYVSAPFQQLLFFYIRNTSQLTQFFTLTPVASMLLLSSTELTCFFLDFIGNISFDSTNGMASNTNTPVHWYPESENKLELDFSDKRLSNELLRQQTLTVDNNSQLVEGNDTSYDISFWSRCCYIFICGVIIFSCYISLDTPKG